MEVATATMDSSNATTPYTIVVSDDDDDEERQQQQQQQQDGPSKPQEVVTAVQEAWEQTSRKVQEAWDAVAHHTVTQVEQKRRAVGPALAQAGTSVGTTVAAVHQSASDLGRAAGDHTRALGEAAGDNARGLSLATQVKVLTTLQATKQSLATIGSNPLIKDEDTGETVVKGETTDAIVTNVAMVPVAAVAATGLISGMVSFLTISAQLVDLASITLIMFAPYVAYQKWQLSSLGGLRGQQNRLRKSANRLSEQNGVLKRSMDHLEAQVKRYVTVIL
jgi:hypothetical protein